ncbi:MAG TPA: TerB family tellurite resistance protein, partial [Rhizomicrobium sp.]|nr:TerB family tellurite resistance protein [Rhizomicrobium sp.]
MFTALMRLLDSPTPPPAPDLRLSVAVLLLEAARQDDTFDARERATIEALLTGRFGLSQAECAALMTAA